MTTISRSAIALLLSLTPLASVLVVEDLNHLSKPDDGKPVEIAGFEKSPADELLPIPALSSHTPAPIRRAGSSHSGKEQVGRGDGTDASVASRGAMGSIPPPPPPPPPATGPVSSN